MPRYKSRFTREGLRGFSRSLEATGVRAYWVCHLFLRSGQGVSGRWPGTTMQVMQSKRKKPWHRLDCCQRGWNLPNIEILQWVIRSFRDAVTYGKMGVLELAAGPHLTGWSSKRLAFRVSDVCGDALAGALAGAGLVETRMT